MERLQRNRGGTFEPAFSEQWLKIRFELKGKLGDFKKMWFSFVYCLL